MTSRDLYTIVYHNKRCLHSTLRSFPKKRHFVCLGCGSDCQMCEVCEKVFTLKTLKKYGGICGKCDKYEEEDLEDVFEETFAETFEKVLSQGQPLHDIEDIHGEDDEDECKDGECKDDRKVFPLYPPLPKRPRPNERLKQQLTVEIPFLFPFQLLQQPPQVPFAENFDNREIPISEMRLEKEDANEEKEVSEGIVKNILAEDPQKKLWLVEWDGEEHATWEDYSTVKDSVIFKEYIEKRMV